ncbi:hypothetical protein FACS1894158_09510 [Betaproteobacteria bacterium]|nr:hypothetical protein FACS1894158_09510 [Betaproteobacteria bacterium]
MGDGLTVTEDQSFGVGDFGELAVGNGVAGEVAKNVGNLIEEGWLCSYIRRITLRSSALRGLDLFALLH